MPKIAASGGTEQAQSAFAPAELAIVRRAYAAQMLAVVGVANPAVEAAYAAVSRERFLGEPPWAIASPFGGLRSLPRPDPALLYQDVLFALDPARGVNNGSPSLHARLLDALGPREGARIAHIGAGTGYYTAILAELVGPSGHIVAVEFDPVLAGKAASFLADRSNVSVVVGDGAEWPQDSADGVYVNFAVARPADRWIECLAPGGRLVFPLGVIGEKRRLLGGRHSDSGAALCVQRFPEGYGANFLGPASFVYAEGPLGAVDVKESERLRQNLEDGAPKAVRSLIWKKSAEEKNCWHVGNGWALSFDEITA
ncbi:MAG: methyltransferase domain-containing protein [Methylocystis sp.]|nr:methyltransferase domain-containing protein [Methylocystis sp.]